MESLISKTKKRYSKPWAALKRKDSRDNSDLIKRWVINRPKNPFYREGEEPITREDMEFYALLDWVIPDYKYDYEILNLEKLSDFFDLCDEKDYSTTRSSFIPLVQINGDNFWLLGSFHDYAETNNPILMDFGGKCEPRDRTTIFNLKIYNSQEELFRPKTSCPALNCAFRETNEESRGLLTNIISEAIQNVDNLVIIRGRREERKEQIFFIFVSLDYQKVQDIPYRFRSTTGTENLGPLGFYDQRDIKNRTYRTNKNLTDLVSFLKNNRI